MRSVPAITRALSIGLIGFTLPFFLFNSSAYSQGSSPFRREISPADVEPEFLRKWNYDPSKPPARPENDGRRRIRVVYLVPSDRQIRPEYTAAIANAFNDLQEFFRLQMGSGYTFILGTPTVEVYRTSQPAAWYNTNPNGGTSLWFWNNTLSHGFAASGGRFNDPNNRWIYYIDSDNACGQAIGGVAGVALMSANDLRGLNGESALVASCPNDPTVSPGVNRWIGGAGHEMGHALGLPHPPGCGTGGPNYGCTGGITAADSLMWVGYAYYPNTWLLPADKQSLSASGFFYNLVSIKGRVTANGRGLANALIRMESVSGTRYAMTNHLGYYRFPDLNWNEPQTVHITHKRYIFSTRQLTPTANMHAYDISP
jgi:hypothetical protein